MAVSMAELKKARDIIADYFSISSGDAARAVGAFNAAGRGDDLRAVIGGDLSSVPGVLSDLGITGSITDSKPAAGGSVGAPGGAVAASGSASDKIPASKHKAVTGQNKGVKHTSIKDGNKAGAGDPSAVILPFNDGAGLISSDIPTTKGDIIKDDTAEVVDNGSKLPEGFADTVRAWFDSWAEFEGVNLSKIHAQQWRAACMMIGQRIKAGRVLYDEDKIKARGGVIYSGDKLEELLQVWAYFCGTFKQVPLVSDFVSFSGVSSSYFYDYTGRGLSSSSVAILQKARAIEAGGLSSSVAGGGAGVIGGIFLLKARHGYSETVNVNHVSSAHDNTAAALPVFGDNGLCLEDSEKNVDNSP